MGEYAVNGVTLVVPDEMLNERVAGKLASGTYEAHEAHAAQMRLREGMRVLELGAGVGVHRVDLCGRGRRCERGHG